LWSNRWTGTGSILLKPNYANYTTLQLRITTKIMVTFSIVKASNFIPNTLFIPSPQSIISNYTIPSFHILTNSLFTPFYLMTKISATESTVKKPINAAQPSADRA